MSPFFFGMLNYWNETIENIMKDQRSTFKLIVNNVIYEVSLSYALGISSLITENYLKDPTFNELTIEIIENNDIKEKEIHEEFRKFIRGEKISREVFYQIGISLMNKEMIKKWCHSYELTNETYIGNHFEEMKEEIKLLRDEELIFILKNCKVTVEKEDIIWEIVKERIEGKNKNKIDDKQRKEKKLKKSMLIGAIESKYLKKEYFREYIEKIEDDDIIDTKVLENIIEILLRNINNLDFKIIQQEEKDNIEKIIKHEEGNNFDGILKYLQDEYGEKIFSEGISISASSTQNRSPKDVIDYKNDYEYKHWRSSDKPDSWLEIAFIQKKVRISGYSFQSSHYPVNDWHLKS